MSEQEVFEALKYRVEVNSFGTRRYYNSNGEFHRIDGPAVEWSNGNKLWCQNGLRHRTDGPAIEYADGSKSWYKNDQYHRTDGPAIDWTRGCKAWYINGEELTKAEFNQRVKNV